MSYSRRGFLKTGLTTTATGVVLNVAGGKSLYAALIGTPDGYSISGPELFEVKGRLQAVFSLADGRLMGWWVDGNLKNQEAVARNDAIRKAMARYSSDGGKTWTDPEMLFELPSAFGVYSHGPGFIDQKGTIHLFGLHYEGCGGGGFANVASCRCRLYHVSSVDRGKTWNSPQYCDFGHEYTGAINSVIQLRSGRILAPVSYFSERRTGKFITNLTLSDDNGKTWRPSKGECIVDSGGNLLESGAAEPICIELKDGRVWMLLRTQTGYQYEVFSADGGDTWTDPVPSRFISSNSPGAFLRLRDGRLVLVWNNCMGAEHKEGVMSSYDRQVLVAAISVDDGKTWKGYREVARIREGEYQVSYPTLTESSDGYIIVSSLAEPEYFPQGVVRVHPNWLTETHVRDNFKHGLADWVTFGCEGATAIQHPNHPGSDVLSLRKPKADIPAAASWNFPFGTSGKLHLRLQMEPSREFTGLYQYLSLADFFSLPRLPRHSANQSAGWDFFPAEDCFSLRLAPDGQLAFASAPGIFQTLFTSTRTRLTRGQWYTLNLAWDCTRSICSLDIDGHRVADLPLLRAAKGVCYLRLCATAEIVEYSGLLVESVECTVNS
ncbi:MAG: exo-alpha-sialidase [Acidobacteria bacterium]|nr:exo-alpha-sialidase [Acidobacteriota bacterium]